MISRKTSTPRPAELVVVDIGNTCTSVATHVDGTLENVVHLSTSDRKTIHQAVTSCFERLDPKHFRAVVIASVVPNVLNELLEHIGKEVNGKAFVIGRDIPLPLALDLTEPEMVGTDRVCAAAAAYDKLGHSCTIVDFGTAITIDCVSDDGVFLGGAILPGPGLQARSLHEHTAALPLVTITNDFDLPGTNTEEAIRGGVFAGVIGAVREIIERYATKLDKWPQVIATGGQAKVYAGAADFFDSVVGDLCLAGVALAYHKHAASGNGP